jgi:cation transport ATPase
VLGAWFLLAAIPCALMMGAMVWMMVSMARGGHGSA